MRDRKVAVRYAKGLLGALPDSGDAERVDRFLTGYAEAIRSDRDLREAMEDPAVPRTSKEQVLRELAKQLELPDRFGGFIDTVVAHGRVGALPAIGEVFHELREERAGIVPATLRSAAPLSPELEARARAALENMTGKKVRLECVVDPDLIGGAVTQIGSEVFDGSLRTQLRALHRRMMSQE